jgi:starch-binding outer membrane protein, SusD/RagB family
MRTIASLLLASLLATSVTACELDVNDLNNPGIDDLETNPTPVTVAAACTGLLVGNRRNTAQANGYVSQLGILGREAYNLDAADPRFVRELLDGALNQGSPFGGNFWANPYANIQLANIVQRAVAKVPDTGLDAEAKKAILGFTKTIQAADLLEVINTHDTNGAVIDTAGTVDQLGAIVEKPAVFAEITRLLDAGATDLAAGGMTFPFPLSSGYRGFDTPPTFLKFNRALRARVAAYMKDYAALKTALDQSFINADAATLATLAVGVYHSYSIGSGDQVNALINPNIYAHPSLKTDVQMQGANPDDRFARKVKTTADPGSGQGLTSDLVFTIYQSPSSPVPIIRNEELILLRAEQLFFGTPSDVPGALVQLNVVRQTSGNLNPLSGTLTAAQFTDALLYERRYSLLFEGGHRWIDVRRFDKIAAKCGATDCIPLDKATSKRNVRYPIPLTECNARPTDEPHCALGSQ